MRASQSVAIVERLSPSLTSEMAHYNSRPNIDEDPSAPSYRAHQPLFSERDKSCCEIPAEALFGPFRLRPAQFLLLEGRKAVSIGSRALEILNVLLERPGELVSKQELMARVWPNIFVEPANLTVHISALRRTLRDGQDGNRFIVNVPGRGYCFVAPIEYRGTISQREQRRVLGGDTLRRTFAPTNAPASRPWR